MAGQCLGGWSVLVGWSVGSVLNGWSVFSFLCSVLSNIVCLSVLLLGAIVLSVLFFDLRLLIWYLQSFLSFCEGLCEGSRKL
jgi:hypothetical protein